MQWMMKYLFSYLKASWDLDDYPLRFRHQKNLEPLGRWQPIPWTAQIVNWWTMAGHGQTKEEAYEDLKQKFQQYKESGEPLPRPGTGRPIEFASTGLIDLYEDLSKDFLRRVFDLNYEECFISDQSSLWDFYAEESLAPIYQKIEAIYNVDVSDIADGNLVRIFTRLHECNAQPKAKRP